METINSEPQLRVAPKKCARITKWFSKCSDCKNIDDFSSKILAIKGSQTHIYDVHNGRGSILAGRHR